MRNMKVQKINIEGFITSIMALFLILNCQSVWQNSVETNYHIYEICLVSIIIYCAYMIGKYGLSRNKMSKTCWIILGYLTIILLIVVFSVSVDNLIRFLSRFLVLPFFMLVFSTRASAKKQQLIFSKIVNWTSVIAWISIVMWTLSTVGVIKPTGFIRTDWMGSYDSYYGLYFSNNWQRIDFALGVRRNLGLFTEGPMYMIVLIFAIAFAMIISDYYPVKKWRIVGMIVALVLTASTTGYLMLVIFSGMQLINRHKNLQNKIIIFMVVIGVGIIAGSIVLQAKSGTASYMIRMDDYFAGIKAWLRSPIVGNGYENVDLLRKYMAANRGDNYGFSNTIFSILAYGGILFLIPFLLPIIIGLSYSTKSHDYKTITFCVVYFVLYFTVIFYTFYVNFLIWGWLINYKKDNDSSLALVTVK